MPTPLLNQAEILKALSDYYEKGDLTFIETVNNLTYQYKYQLKIKLTEKRNAESGQ